MTFAAYEPPWIAPWATPGVGLPGFHGSTAASPTTKISGWPGIVRSGSTSDPAGPVGRGAGRLRDGPREARGRGRPRPTARSAPGSSPRPVRRRSRGRCPRRCRRRASSSGPRRRAARAGAAPTPDRSGGYGGRTRSIASTRMIRASPELDRPEVALERVVGDLAERARQLDPGRAAADEHERHPRAPPLGIGLALGRLEGDQDPAADLGRVLDGLEPGRDRRPLGMVEVRVMRAGRDDQRVVGDRARRPPGGPRGARGRCRSPRRG